MPVPKLPQPSMIPEIVAVAVLPRYSLPRSAQQVMFTRWYMLPRKKPRKHIVTVRPVLESSLYMKVRKKAEKLARAIATIATGERFP